MSPTLSLVLWCCQLVTTHLSHVHTGMLAGLNVTPYEGFPARTVITCFCLFHAPYQYTTDPMSPSPCREAMAT